MKAKRGDEALRRFRASLPQADYFITANLDLRSRSTLNPGGKESVRQELTAIEADGHWTIRAAVNMPDHLHLLVTLGIRLKRSWVMARLKARTRLTLLAQGMQWQPNFYEHRLRPDDDPTNTLRDIFLNPYRAGLIPPASQYPWFWLGSAEENGSTPAWTTAAPSPSGCAECSWRERAHRPRPGEPDQENDCGLPDDA